MKSCLIGFTPKKMASHDWNQLIGETVDFIYSIELGKTNQHPLENDKKQQARLDELKRLIQQVADRK